MEGSLSPLRDCGWVRRGEAGPGEAGHGQVRNHLLAYIRVRVPDGEMPSGVWVWLGEARRGEARLGLETTEA